MIQRLVRGVVIACGVSGLMMASPQESQACCNWFCPGSCGSCAQSTYAAPYTTAYPFGGFFANLFGGGPNRCGAPACSPCAPACGACYVPQTCYRPVAVCNPCTGGAVTTFRPVTTWMRQVSYAPYTPCGPCGSPCGAYGSACSSCPGSCGVAIGAPSAGCGCAAPSSILAPSAIPSPATGPTTFAPASPAPSNVYGPSNSAPTPVPALPPASPAPSAAPGTQPTGSSTIEPVTPQPLSGPINSPAALPRYTAPQPIPGPNNNVAPIPLPRLPTLEKTTSLSTPSNVYLISSRPAIATLPATSSRPAILDNDGWTPARD